jgi:hypothetical protein
MIPGPDDRESDETELVKNALESPPQIIVWVKRICDGIQARKGFRRIPEASAYSGANAFLRLVLPVEAPIRPELEEDAPRRRTGAKSQASEDRTGSGLKNLRGSGDFRD